MDEIVEKWRREALEFGGLNSETSSSKPSQQPEVNGSDDDDEMHEHENGENIELDGSTWQKQVLEMMFDYVCTSS